MHMLLEDYEYSCIPEIRQREALQTIQFYTRRILPGESSLAPILRRVTWLIKGQCNWDVKQTPPPVLGPSASQNSNKPVRVTYLTEQTSHHPPVSAYYMECPERGVSGRGFDQISANFTGTRIRVAPGVHNHGIYITLHNRDETYNLTHPTAHLGGILKGTYTARPSFSGNTLTPAGALTVTVADVCYVTCPKSRLKAILNYQEEGWVGKAKNAMQGVIFKYDPSNDNKTRIKDVSDADVLARVEGSWHDQICVTLGSKAFDKTDKSVSDVRGLYGWS